MFKRFLPEIVTGLLLLSGICVLLYPTISNWLSSRSQTLAIQHYAEAVERLDTHVLDEQWELARSYNQLLAPQVVSGLDEIEVPLGYDRIMDISGTGVMGYVELPVIDVYLPVYHGIEDETLLYGVGHIPETALPIGEEGSHPVLTGHRGVPTSELFNNLDKVEIDDVFYLHVLDETMAYQVDRLTVAYPYEVEALLPIPGEDHVTLVTCTPYNINSHRLLVRGVRIPYDPNKPVAVRPIENPMIDWNKIAVLSYIGIWTSIVLGFSHGRKRMKTKKDLRKRKNAFLYALLGVALTGVGIILYPTVSNKMYRYRAGQVIDAFTVQQELLQIENKQTDPLLESIHAYNKWLFEGGQMEGLVSPAAFEEKNTVLHQLGYEEEILGYITIEKMNLSLPVYLGGGQESMAKGAGHMTHTSIPVGGENTNACIIAHRGMSSAEMFRNIDWLEKGDVIVFSNLWEDLTYVVTSMEVIEPSEPEKLAIQPGRDMLSLVSCYPKGSNRYRYVVYCDRI